MMPRTNRKQVWLFIDVVNYYRDIWARQSHLLHILTAVMSYKAKFKWTDVEDKAFDDIKCALTHDMILE